MRPAITPATTTVARNDSTGSHTSCLSDFNTAHDALAISIDLCHLVMAPLSTIAEHTVGARAGGGLRCREYGADVADDRTARLAPLLGHEGRSLPAVRAPGRGNLIGDHTD